MHMLDANERNDLDDPNSRNYMQRVGRNNAGLSVAARLISFGVPSSIYTAPPQILIVERIKNTFWAP